MKKIIVLLLVLALTFAVIIPASAAGNGPSGGNGNGNGSGVGTGSGTGQGQQGGRGTFAITGTITAIGSNSVTVNVLRGNKLVQPYIGTQVTVTVNTQTRYVLRSSATTAATIITFADLKVGQSVSVNGTLANGVWTTSRITVGASLSCLP
jgi:hypothetical protein